MADRGARLRVVKWSSQARSPYARVGSSYHRVFRPARWHCALVMPGELRRSRDGLTGFESDPVLFCPDVQQSSPARDPTARRQTVRGKAFQP